MAIQSIWASYAPSYRANEMRQIAGWIRSGVCGSVVGLIGCGRSNLLKYLCEYPKALQSYLPEHYQQIALVAVDLHDLPSNQLVDLYRTILHAFYWVRSSFPERLAETITDLYLAYRSTNDAFLAQKALYELILAFQHEQMRVVLVMNRFDRFCETSTPHMLNTLRSLRDRFKSNLIYIVGMRQAVSYLPEPTILGDMYELFDHRICYVGALAQADAQHLAAELLHNAPKQPTLDEVSALLQLSGGFPSLIKTVAELWAQGDLIGSTLNDWRSLLIENPAMLYRLERLWQGLTQEEKLLLTEIQKRATEPNRLATAQYSEAQPNPSAVIQTLATKGCCVRIGTTWQVNGLLLAAYVERNIGNVRGRIWFDQTAKIIYQGQQPLQSLTPLEFDILRFLIMHPHIRHTSDMIIDKAWPPDENKHAITANNLQVHISSIRKKIEPNSSAPRYLITWNGRPGGYQFIPEGKPE